MIFYQGQIFTLNKKLYSNECMLQQAEKAKQFIDNYFAIEIEMKNKAAEVFLNFISSAFFFKHMGKLLIISDINKN